MSNSNEGDVMTVLVFCPTTSEFEHRPIGFIDTGDFEITITTHKDTF